MYRSIARFSCLTNCLTPAFVISLLLVASCKQSNKGQSANALFTLQPSSATGINFINTVQDNDQMNIFNYHNFYNGGGVAIGDINNDGLPDIFFTSNQGSNALYVNKGNFTFEDVTTKANLGSRHWWHTGVSMVDINADGWLDIYVCNAGIILGDDRANELYVNQKNGTFNEEAKAYGLDDEGPSTQAVFFDYDHDGDLDCFVLNNSPKSFQSFGYSSSLRNVRDPINGDRLYRNNNGKFTDVSAEAGIYGGEIAFGLGVAVGDVNNDGWEDMYVCNDFFEKDYLYINQQNSTFKEVVNNALGHMSNGSMGTDMADMNNDGYLDIFTAEMLPENDYRLKTTVKFDDYDVQASRNAFDFHQQLTCNSLQLNNHNGTFSEISQLAGVDATGWSWGALWFDFDNNGWKDLYVCNGLSRDLTDQDFLEFIGSEEARSQLSNGGSILSTMLKKMPAVPITNYAFQNQQNLRFANNTVSLGFGQPSFSNGAAYADLDGDGDLDLVVNNVNLTSFVYKNNASETLGNHYLTMQLRGSDQNTFGYGATVTLFAGGQQQLLNQMPGRGFQSSVNPVLVAGVGKQTLVDSLVIKWPRGGRQKLINVKVDTTIVLHQLNAVINAGTTKGSSAPWFADISETYIKGNSLHTENEYVDFDVERLLPKLLSTEGPKLAVADVNGDGLDDIFVGGATNDTAKLFIQQTNSTFKRTDEPAFTRDRFFEDVDATFFDADGDGDQDLAIASGGSQQLQNGAFLFSRLYINDGKANFSRSTTFASPNMNASCITVLDFNNDGLPDIFIGARNIVGAYGVLPASALLQNMGRGVFADVTKTVAPALQKLGMVTDAHWADVDGNTKAALVVVGDWMPITILKYVKGKLSIATEVPHSAGWWNCLEVADVNGDGFADLVAGNFGLNSNIKASQQQPARLYVNDFDNNGTTECVPVYFKSDGKAYPYWLKGEMQAQIPELKKRLLMFKDYAGKPMDQVFTSKQLANATVLSVQQTQSCVFINDGKGNFTMQPLPVMAQLSPVFTIAVSDLNRDGISDLFLAGNFFGLKPQTGRFDASYGTTLLGTKRGEYQLANPATSGLFAKGEIRDVKMVVTRSKDSLLVVARNTASLLIFGKATLVQ